VQGLHLTADLHRCPCDAAWLTDAARLTAWCGRPVVQTGLQRGEVNEAMVRTT
jgi:S-adenosylmethionine decarboxylase